MFAENKLHRYKDLYVRITLFCSEMVKKTPHLKMKCGEILFISRRNQKTFYFTHL